MVVDKIGLIGLGLLGTAVAKRLIGAGFTIQGFDIDEGCRTRCGSIGGQPAQSPSEVANEQLLMHVPKSELIDTE